MPCFSFVFTAYVSFILLTVAGANEVISIFGSSVANGFSCSGNCSGNAIVSDEGGCYQSRLRVFQRDNYNRHVVNNARNGDTTGGLLSRFSEMLSVKPTFVVIGLSLANEGILNGNQQGVFDQYATNMQVILNQSYSHNVTPILLSCYPHSSYGPTEYDYITSMNILSQSWGSAQVNVLGAIDDGTGKWADGFWYDGLHPNDAGSTLMYRAFVPTLLEAIQAGKSSLIPRVTNKFASLTRFSLSGHSLTFNTPLATPIFPWAVGLWIRVPLNSASSGDILTISATTALGLKEGKLEYRAAVVSENNVDDGKWHYVVLSHRWANSVTVIYFDGVMLTQVTESISPTEFSLGTSASGATADLREWSIYRSALSQAEVFHMYRSSMVLPASLEVYAPLDPLKISENHAQSMSELNATSARPSVDISVFGSSVANGYTCTGNCSGQSSTSDNGGCYQSRFRVFQKSLNRTVFNNARNGDNTILLLDRFSEMLSVNPKHVLIGLSLANEGLIDPSKDASQVYAQYARGMQQLINMSYSNNILPFIGSCYPNNDYNSTQYEYITRMNIESQSWGAGVPQINFLGATDDGSGKWSPGFFSDYGHPNDEGSTLMYHAIVPSLLEAIATGKPARVLRKQNNHGVSSPSPSPDIADSSSSTSSPTVASSATSSPTVATVAIKNQFSFSSLTFTTKPASSVYSWAVSLSFRAQKNTSQTPFTLLSLPLVSSGDYAAAVPTLGMQNGWVHYENIVRTAPVDDGKWHTIVISHKWAINQTVLYLDGIAFGQVSERAQPSQVVLQSPPGGVELRDWVIYRSSLNQPEVLFMVNSSYILQASLEVYAPLESANLAANYAQSMSTLQLAVPARNTSAETLTERISIKSRTNDYIAVGVFSAVLSLGCLVGMKYLSRTPSQRNLVKVTPR